MNYVVEPHTLNEDLPLIYMWEIRNQAGQLVGRYVGKAKAGAKRPRTHYSRNVANILAGRAYRNRNPVGYRRIHRVLAEAATHGHVVRLYFLCNVQPHENINRVERFWIQEQRSQGSETWQLNG